MKSSRASSFFRSASANWAYSWVVKKEQLEAQFQIDNLELSSIPCSDVQTQLHNSPTVLDNSKGLKIYKTQKSALHITLPAFDLLPVFRNTMANVQYQTLNAR